MSGAGFDHELGAAFREPSSAEMIRPVDYTVFTSIRLGARRSIRLRLIGQCTASSKIDVRVAKRECATCRQLPTPDGFRIRTKRLPQLIQALIDACEAADVDCWPVRRR